MNGVVTCLICPLHVIIPLPAPAPLPAVEVSGVHSESCSLLCVVEKVDDETVVSWYRGEKLVNQSSTVSSLPLTVEKEALNSSYSCVAANPAHNNTLSPNITQLCREHNTGVITGKDSSNFHYSL